MKIVTTVVFLLTLNSSLIAGIKVGPSWIHYPSQQEYQNCAFGIGRVSAKYPKEEALMMALLEQGLRESATVKSSYSHFESEDKSDMSDTEVIKILANTSMRKMHQKEFYKDAGGNIYALICSDKEGIAFKEEAAELKLYSGYTKNKQEEKIDVVFKVSINNYIDFQDVPKDPLSSRSSNPDEPKWVNEPELEGGITGIGSSKIYKENIQEAYITAMMRARVAIAQNIGAKVKHMVQNYKQETDGAVDKIKSQVSKMVTNQTLKGSRLFNIWIDSMNQELFVRVAMDEKESPKKDDKALWKQYIKKQKD